MLSSLQPVRQVFMPTPSLFLAVFETRYSIWFYQRQAEQWTCIYEHSKLCGPNFKVTLLGRLLFILDDVAKPSPLDILLLRSMEDGGYRSQKHKDTPNIVRIHIEKSGDPPYTGLADSSSKELSQEESNLVSNVCRRMDEGFLSCMSGDCFLFVRRDTVYDIKKNCFGNFLSFSLQDSGCFIHNSDLYYSKNKFIWVYAALPNIEPQQEPPPPVLKIWATCSHNIKTIMPVYNSIESSSEQLLCGIWVTLHENRTYFYPLEDPRKPIHLELEARFLGATSTYLFYQASGGRVYKAMLSDRSSILIAKEPQLCIYVPGSCLPYKFLMFFQSTPYAEPSDTSYNSKDIVQDLEAATTADQTRLDATNIDEKAPITQQMVQLSTTSKESESCMIL